MNKIKFNITLKLGNFVVEIVGHERLVELSQKGFKKNCCYMWIPLKIDGQTLIASILKFLDYCHVCRSSEYSLSLQYYKTKK